MGHYERISVGDKIKELATNEIMIRMSFDSSVGWKLVVGFPEMRRKRTTPLYTEIYWRLSLWSWIHHSSCSPSEAGRGWIHHLSRV